LIREIVLEPWLTTQMLVPSKTRSRGFAPTRIRCTIRPLAASTRTTSPAS
jgi:hypothetical protein